MGSSLKRHLRTSITRSLIGSVIAILVFCDLASSQVDNQSNAISIPNENAGPVQFELEFSKSIGTPGDLVELRITGQVATGWHIYPIDADADRVKGLPTKIRFLSSSLRAAEDSFRLQTSPEEVSPLELSNTFTWVRKYRLKNNKTVPTGRGSISFQVCNQEECLPPTELKFNFDKSRTAGKQAANVLKNYKPIGKPIKIRLEPANMERPQVKFSGGTLLWAGLGGGKSTESLKLKGEFSNGQDKLNLYLRKRRSYTLTNSNPEGTRFTNDAEYLSIDYDGNNLIEDFESHGVNRPIRLWDSMYLVLSIDAGSRELQIQQVEVPLSGTIVGRKCPPFQYQTVDGNAISDSSLRGKVTILDIWAVT